jgi:hypothetical protein
VERHLAICDFRRKVWVELSLGVVQKQGWHSVFAMLGRSETETSPSDLNRFNSLDLRKKQNSSLDFAAKIQRVGGNRPKVTLSELPRSRVPNLVLLKGRMAYAALHHA